MRFFSQLLYIFIYTHFAIWAKTLTLLGHNRIAFSLLNNSRKVSAKSVKSQTNYPLGLQNLRNTCYMNSVLQSIYNSDVFRKAVSTETFNNKSIGHELQQLFLNMEARQKISTKSLAQNMGINVGIQEDAEEFMLKLLNSIDTSMKQSKDMKSNEKLSKSFEIEVQQVINCTKVNYASTTTQKYMDISVDINDNTKSLTDSLNLYFKPEYLIGDNKYKSKQFGYQDAVKSLFITKLPQTLVIHLKRFAYDMHNDETKKIITPLTISLELDMTPYKQCNTISPATSTTFRTSSSSTNVADIMTSSASNTTVNFGSDKSTVATDTIEKQVDIVDNNKKAALYELSSVIIHEGDSLDSGHYYTLMRPQPQYALNVWYKINDHIVTKLTTEEVLRIANGLDNNKNCKQQNVCLMQHSEEAVTRSAYMLFYTGKK